MPSLTVTIEAFTRLGPSVIAVDDDHVVRWVSESLTKLLDTSIAGQELDNFVVAVDRPFVALGLRTKSGNTLPLRGSWMPATESHLRVFVGSPVPETTEEMQRLGITIDDLPEDDSWLNYLILADECAATQNNARSRIGQLKRERTELNEARDQMRDARRAALNMLSDVDHARQLAEKAHAELRDAQQQLVEASRLAGMSEVATDVLHNVGNVLNSVNVSAGLVSERIRGSRVPGLAKATALMSEHAHDLDTFITRDERGRQLPGYLAQLADHLADEQSVVLDELRSLTENIEHIKNIISMQQSLTGTAGVVEPVRVGRLLDDLLKMDAGSCDRHGVRVLCEYDEHPVVNVDKHRLTQILVNLLKNDQRSAERGRAIRQADDSAAARARRRSPPDRSGRQCRGNTTGESDEDLRARLYNEEGWTRFWSARQRARGKRNGRIADRSE